jgi:hypothetical protein
LDGTGKFHFVSHFSGNVKLTRVVTEDVLASPSAINCTFGFRSELIDISYLSGAVEKVGEKGMITGHDACGVRGV